MKVGDMVQLYWSLFLSTAIGIDRNRLYGLIIKIHNWVDSGAPDRNHGTSVHVLWPNGDVIVYEHGDLEVVG